MRSLVSICLLAGLSCLSSSTVGAIKGASRRLHLAEVSASVTGRTAKSFSTVGIPAGRRPGYLPVMMLRDRVGRQASDLPPAHPCPPQQLAVSFFGFMPPQPRAMYGPCMSSNGSGVYKWKTATTFVPPDGHTFHTCPYLITSWIHTVFLISPPLYIMAVEPRQAQKAELMKQYCMPASPCAGRQHSILPCHHPVQRLDRGLSRGLLQQEHQSRRQRRLQYQCLRGEELSIMLRAECQNCRIYAD